MSETPGSALPDQPVVPEIDTAVPHSARVWNYWLGGTDNYAADRLVGDQFREKYPAMVDNARAFRHFLVRAVGFLAGEVGLRQFLDIGTGLPTAENTHEVAQRMAPECRIVYVDNDPLVSAHARRLLGSAPEGATAYIDGDVHDTAAILRRAGETIDFDEPVGLVLSGILGHIEQTAARSVVRRLMYEFAPGSHLVVCDGTDTSAALNEAQRRHNNDQRRDGGVAYYLRNPEKIAEFFEGLELVEPGVVPCPEWRSEPGSFTAIDEVHAVGGVGRKP